VVALHVTIPPAWFDPAETPAQITPFGILYALHEAMVRPLPGARMALALAASWAESPDGLTYEFKLRPGLKFHNGDPCTAEDVEYSFARYKGTGAKDLQAKVQRLEIIDPLTVRFHLREPWPDFMTFYGTTATAAGLIVPKKYLERVGEDGFKKHPIGLGPYKFVSYTPGVELVLEAYEGYWRKVPNIKRLILKGVPEDATRLAMLKSGEADIAFALDGQVAAEVQRDARLTLAYTLHASSFWLEFPEQWEAKSVWADKRVRLAVNYALDRQTINEAACLGFCPPAGVIIPRVMEHALPAEPLPYDPQKARQLLAEAGYPNGFDGGDFVPTPPFVLAGEAVVNYLNAVGIRIRMRTMERATFLTEWREKKLRGVFLAASGVAGNAATRAETFICSTGSFAAGGYADIDALCQEQKVERNRARREDLLYRIQQLTIERVMFAPIMDFRALVGIGPRVVEHALDVVPLHAFPAWEDVRLKGQRLTTAAASPPAVAAPPPATAAPPPDAAAPPPATRAALAPPPTSSTSAAPQVAPLPSDQTALVVLDGVVTPQRLQKKVTGYRNVPNVKGFSVQSAPNKSLEELVAAGRLAGASMSVTTVAELLNAAQSVGVTIQIIPAPGLGFHRIVVTPRPLPEAAAQALSKVFQQVPAPASGMPRKP
jgi:peptide/nickel transport system substrate-binding protein